ncbi:DUF192 domain-containing protein [Actibacterium sp. XHP0104]|uniref:DUF192 domain-containing protein n=1 Tax=Actibacterium sp. XHP0104 TaxID=2984335 RepID=UPI0021E7EF98|nr:DUF192 domain-containing protein [Actibacterium sp. XHP0104]MCV2880883.1 DUF192 domain-containing protein [Actibacterium sp. XHP0104]
MGKRDFLRALFLGLSLALAATAAGAMCEADEITLRGARGEMRFHVELADSHETRARGLMFVENLPMGQGMLFVYPAPQRATFWMKNTLIPLDMVFMDAQGRVTRVHENAVPHDLTPIDGGEGVRAVLEINGGLARAAGIEPGAVARHPAFGAGALWPCATP